MFNNTFENHVEHLSHSIGLDFYPLSLDAESVRRNTSHCFAGGSEVKKALVALPDEVWDIIDQDLKDKLGTGHSDIIRAIVVAYLSEKGYLDKGGKPAEER